MTSQIATSSFSFAHDPKPLADALARVRVELEDARTAYLFPEDNDWAAATFMVELLLQAKRRRTPLNRECASEILRAGGSRVTIGHLEDLGFARFVLGRLQIPEAVRAELTHKQHVDLLPEAERAALKHHLKAGRHERRRYGVKP